jgi:sugar phosphate isomerase/epimerase
MKRKEKSMDRTAAERKVKGRIQVHIPYGVLVERLDEVLAAGLNPEIFLDGDALDRARPGELKEVYRALNRNGRTITIHGPYMDLSPGGADEKVRLTTVERYRQTFEAVKELRPMALVLHSGYDQRRFDGDVGLWLGQSEKTWPEFIKKAERLNTVIAVENIFDEGPAPLKALMDSLNTPNFRICLDAGHLNLFSEAPMEEWFQEIGGFVAEVHVHDNRGEIDDHLPAGDGIIDFQKFFRLLKEFSPEPIYTIEPHGEEVLWRGVEALEGYL